MKPAAALLAAGSSTRLGRPKAFLEIDGTTFLRRLVDELAAVAAPVIVVLPPDDERYLSELAGSPAVPIRNPDPRRGMGSSIACAAEIVDERHAAAPALLVALVDQPFANRELFSALIAAAAGGRGWAASDYGETFGPPALFPRSALGELARLSGDRGARALLARHRESLAMVPFPAGRYDVDTPEDLERLTKLGGGTGDGN